MGENLCCSDSVRKLDLLIDDLRRQVELLTSPQMQFAIISEKTIRLSMLVLENVMLYGSYVDYDLESFLLVCVLDAY